MNPNLIILFFLIVTSLLPVYSKVTEESFRTANLPSFRHNKNYIELQGINTLDLLLQPDAKTVSVEVTGAENNKLKVDKKSGKVFGLEIIPVQRLKTSHINNNAVYHKRNNKRVINKASFNLTKRSAKPLLIEGKNFKTFKLPVRGIFSGSYTLKVVVNGERKTETQVITKENFRIDSITPSVIGAGVESQLTILGKGLDLFTNVSFYDPNGKEVQITDISEVESLDESTLKIKVLIPKDYTPGFHNVTITNSLSPNQISTLLNGLFIGAITGGNSTNTIGVCDDPNVSLMINALEVLPEGDSVTVFDSTLCQLTVGIPRSKDEGRAVGEITVSPTQSSNLLSMGFCNNSTDTLMFFTNNLIPGSNATVFFDPVKCNLTFGIPVGFNGINGENGSNGSNGMGLCNDKNAIPTTMTVTVPATSAATIDLDPVACTITYGIPQGETGSQGQSGFSCWDLNLNKTCDLASEDKNADSRCNPFDCQGDIGITGETGIDCWDLNENRSKDPNEDVNGDGFVDVLDCIGLAGASGLNSLVNTLSEAAGLNCTTGGKKIQSGIDLNNNGALDSSEVLQTNYVCNGAAGATGITGATGLSSLVNTTSEAAGLNCITGGKKIQSGIDLNNNGVLDSSEVLQTEYVCNGATGTNGLSSLVNATSESVGLNCTTGGKKIQSGLDLNNNGILDSSEVLQTGYVCNGATGATGESGTNGLNSLVKTTDEPAGSNCITGGVKVQSGLDSNENGVLDSSEVSQTDYVCNGATGTNGLNSLVKTTDETAGSNCTTGGKKIQSGLDSNNNGILDSSEVSQTDYVCNGATGTNGLNSLVSTTDEAAGSNCTTGGKKIQSGLDSNNNGVLDSTEVSQTNYVCNGVAATNGTNGLNSLVSTTDEPIGSNCVAGGEKIQSGLDSNNNGILDSSEVLQTNYVCDGATGETGLAGINCWDLNGNRINDSNEDINMDGLFNTYDCSSPQVKLLEEVIIDWINDSSDQNFTTASGAVTRMIKVPYFIHDGVIYGGFWIDKYEASRADASSTAEGTSNIPVSKRSVVPWTNLTLSEAKAAASGRQISDIGSCHLIKMREWYALYLLGRYTKEKGILGATATSGWNERGNTRSGKDGRNNLLFSCADDQTENTIGSGRCLTGTGYKSWGHFLDSTAISNIGLGVSPGFGAIASADLVKDDGDGSGADSFDGDFQIYDLVGNVREWIDFTVTETQDGTIIDPTYQGANEALPFTTTNKFFSFENIATGDDTATIDFEGLGLPESGSSNNITDLNGGANDGKLFTSSTDQQYGVVRGGSWTTGLDSRSPLYLNISTTPTTQETQRGFRVTCGF